ncbi:MAG TPA: protein ndvB, partial [Steroidobacteraceae bacterium]|nr:protein ndvB [Steroidobacteraceae bacterium]
GALEFETDRAAFVGRGRELASAAAIFDARALAGTSGTVLDPVIALRRRVRVAPGETARIDFWCGVAATRTQALDLADKLREGGAFERTQAAASVQARSRLQDLGCDAEEARRFQRLAGCVLYSDPALRAAPHILAGNESGPPALWAHGISGDLPIVLAELDTKGSLDLARRLLRAQELWALKGLAVDLVLIDAREACAAGPSVDALVKDSRASAPAKGTAGVRRGTVFALRADALAASALDLLRSAARAILTGSGGSLEGQLAKLPEPLPIAPPRAADATVAPRRPVWREPPALAAAGVDLEVTASVPAGVSAVEFFNGLGGFSENGREYLTCLTNEECTPAPWINVIANPQFGCLVSAEGSGSTWSLNAQQNQLTPWSNDPVSNAPAEVIYLRDEASGKLWSATPLPIRERSSAYLVRHGFGYSRFEHTSCGVSVDLLTFVPLADPLKISRLKLLNRSSSPQQLSITYYVDWVLGAQRARMAPFIVTGIDAETRSLNARCPWSIDFPSRVAFMDMGGRQQTATGDRAEFLGRYGSLREPAALLRGTGLTNRVGGGFDPCGAMQTLLTLAPGEAAEIVLLLGEESSLEDALALIKRYRSVDLDAALKAVTDFWEQTLGVVQVRTPDRSMDVLLNGWLLYQTLACRLWGRTAFYQSSGAWGYRDQLQDVMALMVAQPRIAREHILRAASRQFAAGDVQHWWLPVTGQGIQTRVSDDRVWLAFVVAQYLEVTGETALLDEPVAFLEGGPLAAGLGELFAAAKPTLATQPLYEHCALALDSSLGVGAHGLPLFGTGDWNDGMNRVGAAGRGESVWLGWFLYATLMRFAPLAQRRGDATRAARWRDHALAVQRAIEREAWDGEWYRRGYYDDGTALGSVSSEECRIDSIAQSWAVISGGAEPERARRAMAAVDARLVDRAAALVKLFTPAFDRTAHDPGYIKAYPPGLRENGGQYTHAALWSTLAFALLGDGDRAHELFSLINPLTHSSTRARVERYKVEPYVVCADVYSAPSHVGRGGWTWYTGSAGWMYRTAIEGMLGLTLRAGTLAIDPCLPRRWRKVEIAYRHGSSRYHIEISNPRAVSRGIGRALLDGREIPVEPCIVALAEDGAAHEVQITLG